MTPAPLVPGDVVQVNEAHGRGGWVGAFVLVTEARPWGVVGFVHQIQDHETALRAPIRLVWEHVEYVGRAPVLPEDVRPPP